MLALTDKQVISVEIGVRGMGESKVQGYLVTLSNVLDCQVFPLGCWPFLGGVIFSWSTALPGSTRLLFFMILKPILISLFWLMEFFKNMVVNYKPGGDHPSLLLCPKNKEHAEVMCLS